MKQFVERNQRPQQLFALTQPVFPLLSKGTSDLAVDLIQISAKAIDFDKRLYDNRYQQENSKRYQTYKHYSI